MLKKSTTVPVVARKKVATSGKRTSKTGQATSKQKDYAYRSTWKHQLSRAKNLAKRGGLTKPEMMKEHGRFPKGNEWWGPEANEKEWLKQWTLEHPCPKS